MWHKNKMRTFQYQTKKRKIEKLKVEENFYVEWKKEGKFIKLLKTNNFCKKILFEFEFLGTIFRLVIKSFFIFELYK